ncbi:hypothetical protein VTK73DRAFT_1887 [Phialemonium thermophilum]|uniref:Centromere protein X n=1 Tax=Phialemonium thermophilum TaxID=223376 RepID=A0ABR3Y3B4_9PEZI
MPPRPSTGAGRGGRPSVASSSSFSRRGGKAPRGRPPKAKTSARGAKEVWDDDLADDAVEDNEVEGAEIEDAEEHGEDRAARGRGRPGTGRGQTRGGSDESEEDGDDVDGERKKIPPELLTRLLHEFFQKDDTRITRDANAAVARYMDTFVREAIARSVAERDGKFMEVEDLEKIAPQLLLDL